MFPESSAEITSLEHPRGQKRLSLFRQTPFTRTAAQCLLRKYKLKGVGQGGVGIGNRQDAPEHDKESTTPCKVNNVFRHCTYLASPGHRFSKCCLLHVPLQQPVLALDRAAATKPDPRKKQSSKLCCLKIRPLQDASSPFRGKWHQEITVPESHLWGHHHATCKM